LWRLVCAFFAMDAMHGVGSRDEMVMQMDPNAQVAALCAEDDPDLAFIQADEARRRQHAAEGAVREDLSARQCSR
jgi:hypothetical protein